MKWYGRAEWAAMCTALQKPWERAMAWAEPQPPTGSPLTGVVGQHAGWQNTAKTSLTSSQLRSTYWTWKWRSTSHKPPNPLLFPSPPMPNLEPWWGEHQCNHPGKGAALYPARIPPDCRATQTPTPCQKPHGNCMAQAGNPSFPGTET